MGLASTAATRYSAARQLYFRVETAEGDVVAVPHGDRVMGIVKPVGFKVGDEGCGGWILRQQRFKTVPT